jgi:hypothetical protein
MTVLQIHRSLVQTQTAPEQKKSIAIYQAIRNQKMKSGVSTPVVWAEIVQAIFGILKFRTF